MNLTITNSYTWDRDDSFFNGFLGGAFPNSPPSIETFYFTTP